MEKYKFLNIENIDKEFANYRILKVKPKSWVRTIRTALAMPLDHLAKRLNISKQALSQLEKNEETGNITINKLEEIASALNFKLHYVLLPQDKNLKMILQEQSLKKAKQLVDKVDNSMLIESQQCEDNTESIKQLAQKLFDNPSSTLWSEDD